MNIGQKDDAEKKSQHKYDDILIHTLRMNDIIKNDGSGNTRIKRFSLSISWDSDPTRDIFLKLR